MTHKHRSAQPPVQSNCRGQLGPAVCRVRHRAGSQRSIIRAPARSRSGMA